MQFFPLASLLKRFRCLFVRKPDIGGKSPSQRYLFVKKGITSVLDNPNFSKMPSAPFLKVGSTRARIVSVFAMSMITLLFEDVLAFSLVPHLRSKSK